MTVFCKQQQWNTEDCPTTTRLEVNVFIFEAAELYVFVFSVCFRSIDLVLPRVHVNTLTTVMPVLLCSIVVPLCINPHNPSVYLIQCAVDLKSQWTRSADRHQEHFTRRGWADWLTYLEGTFQLIHLRSLSLLFILIFALFIHSFLHLYAHFSVNILFW